MRKVNRLQGRWQNVVFSLTSLLIVVADQLSKAWIRANLPEGHSFFEIGFFRLVHARNTGAAFGLFPDQSLALIVVGIVGITVILIFALVIHRRFPWFDSGLGKLALGLVLGGTAGNLIDRLRFGYVTDFIDFDFWPTFNIADSAVTVGCIILAYSLLRLTQAEKH